MAWCRIIATTINLQLFRKHEIIDRYLLGNWDQMELIYYWHGIETYYYARITAKEAFLTLHPYVHQLLLIVASLYLFPMSL